MMGHVNNARYFAYLESARTEYIFSREFKTNPRKMGMIIAHAELDYKSPSQWRDKLEIKLRTSSVGKSSWTYEYEIVNEENGNLVAKGNTVQVTFDYEKQKAITIPEPLKEELLRQLESSKSWD
jgi:acyl-CoA thioester hydrolase